MMRSWRPLVWAALFLAGHVSVAAAQTMVLRNAHAATSIEVIYEGASVGKGGPDPAGTANLALTLAPGTTERVVQFHVDRCQGGVVRIGASERDRLVPAAGPECERAELSGLFIVRRTTSMVIDLGQATPILLIRQGPPPPQWLRGDYTGDMPALIQPRGLTLSGGVSMPRIVKTFELACGDVTPCTATDFRPTLTFGGTYWIWNAVGAEVSIIKNAKLTVKAQEEDLRFTHELATDIVTVAGNLGGMFGTVRVYFRGGLNFHRGTSTIDQTLNDRTVTGSDDVTYVIKGGTERAIVNTEGWGWMLGGGFEWWLKPPFGIYGEAGFNKIVGEDVAGGEAKINDRAFVWTAGGRIHISHLFRRSATPTAPRPPASTP